MEHTIELTKEQRHRVYQAMLVRFNERAWYLCSILKEVLLNECADLFSESIRYRNVSRLLYLFPELKAYKPSSGDVWWSVLDYDSPNQKRLECLEDCIKQTA